MSDDFEMSKKVHAVFESSLVAEKFMMIVTTLHYLVSNKNKLLTLPIPSMTVLIFFILVFFVISILLYVQLKHAIM